MAKNKPAPQQTKAAPVSTSKRAGYKRKTNRRVDVLGAQLDRIARKALKAAERPPKATRTSTDS